MDVLDRKILACLKENARVNATDIGARVELSTSAVIERIRKMETSGLIRQYTVLLDQSQLNQELTAFIYIRLEHPKFNEPFIAGVRAMNAVTECYYVAGEYDFLLKVVTTQGNTLETVLTEIKSIPGVSLTRTNVVLSTSKQELCLLPEEPNL
ncbi:MAG: Lrp/AsnC family transcriptional regulator [Oscillospiraceae bacterium]|nr:Lrp/AsnC family transcriptional regulator [Oscillospiraceae bacterium]